MATKKSPPPPKKIGTAKKQAPGAITGSVMSSFSGPSTGPMPSAKGPTNVPGPAALAAKFAGTQATSEAMPENLNKAGEHGYENALAPQPGQTAKPPTPLVSGSTVSESATSDKVGDGVPPLGENPGNDPLDRVRVDGSDRALTTNQGVPVADNQNSLKQGLRGPTLMEDFILREKITHFDHERIPERVVHARGSAAHGYFECYKPLTKITRAAPFTEAGKRTPVFVRFSTVAGERGSTDTARDVRGFAVKFYTDEGNWDLVGNNIPVFFIQDAMKFPDLVHALKPEPHNAMPQAASAHDTFWDFVSLMPESTHMLMWVMSDRAIPRSYRTMQGFGVHTFRLVNAKGESVFCKFHWTPILGTHSLVWDEAVKISGADPDFHRRDLWESIEAGAFPEYELALQIFTEEQAAKLSFDILDPTKIVPEELVPLMPVGKMVLNRNPDNFFAETEQVAFCTAHIVPGIDFTNDPLLQGRIHSYVDTQLIRLGGPNFHEIPINASVAPVFNNQRDGLHRQAIHRGRVSYEPNSLGGGCPFQAGKMGFVSFPQPPEEDKVRGKPEKFADHFTQARLFLKSQTPTEQAHILGGFRFELTRVQVPAIRERVVSMLANVDEAFARKLADELGIDMPSPQTRALPKPPKPEVEKSPALSLMARPGDGSIRGRRIALLIAHGVEAGSLESVYQTLIDAGAVPRYVGVRLGKVNAASGEVLHVEVSLEAAPSVLFDALVLPDGEAGVEVLLGVGNTLEYVKDQYRHCKPILVLGSGAEILDAANIDPNLPNGEADPGILLWQGKGNPIEAFIAAIARHRHFERETDPPMI
jgi:catalase